MTKQETSANAEIMAREEFEKFINSNAEANTRGGAVYNFKTGNITKSAQTILKSSEFPKLAQKRISAEIKSAYYNNIKFRNKLDAVMADLNIKITQADEITA